MSFFVFNIWGLIAQVPTLAAARQIANNNIGTKWAVIATAETIVELVFAADTPALHLMSPKISKRKESV